MIPTLPRLERLELRPDDITEGDALALTDGRTGETHLALVVAVLPAFNVLYRPLAVMVAGERAALDVPRAPHPAARYVDAYRAAR